MSIETIKMSSRGQIVIPQSIRALIDAEEGTLFAVTGADDTVVLKKLTLPSKDQLLKELTAFAKESKKRLQKQGVTEADLRAK